MEAATPTFRSVGAAGAVSSKCTSSRTAEVDLRSRRSAFPCRLQATVTLPGRWVGWARMTPAAIRVRPQSWARSTDLRAPQSS